MPSYIPFDQPIVTMSARSLHKVDCFSYSRSVGAKHYQTSAKQNKGLDDLFLDAARRMLEVEDTDVALCRGSAGASGGTGFLVTDETGDDSAGSRKSRGCC